MNKMHELIEDLFLLMDQSMLMSKCSTIEYPWITGVIASIET